MAQDDGFTAEESVLYVLATPLGNLRDFTLRAGDILSTVDLILAEDTRVTAKLLSHFGIKKPMRALYQHNERELTAFMLDFLAQKKSLALVSDAGTPAISDPGARLVAAARFAGFRVVPIPGASALTAAVSSAGLRAEHFYFAGFLPLQDKARFALLETLRPLPAALVFYEAPHRVRNTIADLTRLLQPNRPLVIARELTKTFETISRMELVDAADWLSQHPETERGELVLIVDTADNMLTESTINDPSLTRWLMALLEELPPARVARVAAAATSLPRAQLYQEAMRLSGNRKRETGDG